MINTVTKIYDHNNNFVYQITYIDLQIIKCVPNNTANTDYQEIQQWIADGGTVIDNPPE